MTIFVCSFMICWLLEIKFWRLVEAFRHFHFPWGLLSLTPWTDFFFRKKTIKLGLTPGIGQFWLQIRIQHVEISLGVSGNHRKPSGDLKNEDFYFSNSFFNLFMGLNKVKIAVSIFQFLAVLQVPELLQKVREAPGINFHLVAPLTEPAWPS